MVKSNCPNCGKDTMTEPVNGDPLEPEDDYCMNCGYIVGVTK